MNTKTYWKRSKKNFRKNLKASWTKKAKKNWMQDKPVKEFEKIWKEFLLECKEYFHNRISLVKLTLTELISRILASIFAQFILVFILLLFFEFLSIAIGFYIGEKEHSYFLGFMIVAWFYFLAFVFAVLFRKKILERWLINNFIKKILKQMSNES